MADHTADILKVCYLVASLPPHYGGAEMRAFKMAARLRKNPDVQIRLVGWDRGASPFSRSAGMEHVEPVRLRFGRRNRAGRALHVVEARARLGRLFRRLSGEYDLVHIFNAAVLFNLLPIPGLKRLNKRVLVEMTLVGSDDPLKLSRQRGGVRQVFPHTPLKYRLFLQADAYISKSTGLTQAYRRAELPPEKLYEIPSGVDVQKFSPAQLEVKSKLRRDLKLPEAGPLLLFAGGIEARKGVHHLLAAFRELARRDPAPYLVLAGPVAPFDPAYVKQLQDKIRDWGLESRVLLTGEMVSNIESYMQAADIFVLPSSREGFSNALLEAMACGLAVVASDIPEIAGSQAAAGREALLVPAGDEAALAAALADLVSDPARRRSLGTAARQRVERDFDQDQIDQTYLHLYRKLLS